MVRPWQEAVGHQVIFVVSVLPGMLPVIYQPHDMTHMTRHMTRHMTHMTRHMTRHMTHMARHMTPSQALQALQLGPTPLSSIARMPVSHVPELLLVYCAQGTLLHVRRGPLTSQQFCQEASHPGFQWPPLGRPRQVLLPRAGVPPYMPQQPHMWRVCLP
jgi:hypothetical protein